MAEPPHPDAPDLGRDGDLPLAVDPERLQRARDRMETLAPVHLHELAARAEVALGSGAVVERGALMVALSAEHTHFFPGFGLYLPLPGGVAVAARGAAETTVRVEVPRVYGQRGHAPATRDGAWIEMAERVAADVVQRVARVVGQPVEAVAALSMPACGESLIAAVAIAAAQAIGTVGEGAPLDRGSRLALAQQVCEHYAGRAFGYAPCVAALDGGPPRLLLVDADARTSRPVDTPSRDELVWGLLIIEPQADQQEGFARDFFKLRTAQVQAASLLLRHSPLDVGPEPLQTLRDVEHRLLPEALALLPEEQRPVVRHLLGEDRRVPRLLMALKRRDGQVLGATLLVSHASLRDDWGSSNEAVEFLLAQGEGVEGIYGMRMTGTGFGGCVLVVGRPYLLPAFLDTVAARYAEAHDAPLYTLVL